MKYGLGGIVNGAGSYGWGGADGAQFVVERCKGFFTLFMVQTQNYKAPTYPAFLALANEAAAISGGGAGVSGGGGAGGLFKQRDKNGDGKLSRDEIPAALFDRLDGNKDGFVTEEEIETLWRARMSRRPPQSSAWLRDCLPDYGSEETARPVSARSGTERDEAFYGFFAARRLGTAAESAGVDRSE